MYFMRSQNWRIEHKEKLKTQIPLFSANWLKRFRPRQAEWRPQYLRHTHSCDRPRDCLMKRPIRTLQRSSQNEHESIVKWQFMATKQNSWRRAISTSFDIFRADWFKNSWSGALRGATREMGRRSLSWTCRARNTHCHCQSGKKCNYHSESSLKNALDPEIEKSLTFRLRSLCSRSSF